MSCVYKHIFPNGAIYVGSTDQDPEDRWLNGWGYKTSPLMYNAIFYFGWKNIKHEIIADGLTHDEAKQLEIHEIQKLSAHFTLYNEIGTEDSRNTDIHAHESLLNDRTKKIKKRKENVPLLDKWVVPLVPKPNNSYRCQIDVYLLDGTFLHTYNSAKEAGQDLNVNRGDIASCCIGKRSDGANRYQAGGYIFRYHNPSFKVDKKEEPE